jgi:hypothetical protein
MLLVAATLTLVQTGGVKAQFAKQGPEHDLMSPFPGTAFCTFRAGNLLSHVLRDLVRDHRLLERLSRALASDKLSPRPSGRSDPRSSLATSRTTSVSPESDSMRTCTFSFIVNSATDSSISGRLARIVEADDSPLSDRSNAACRSARVHLDETRKRRQSIGWIRRIQTWIR